MPRLSEERREDMEKPADAQQLEDALKDAEGAQPDEAEHRKGRLEQLIPDIARRTFYDTRIKIKNCGVRIVGHKVVGNVAFLTVQTPAAGRVSGSGSGLATVHRRFTGAKRAISLRIPLSSKGRHRGRPFHAKIRVGFVPKRGSHSAASVTVTFR